MMLKEINGTYQMEVGTSLTSQALSEEYAALHVHPTRYMGVYNLLCVCVRWGGTIYTSSTPQQLMARVKGRRMQVYVHMYTCVLIMCI